MAHKKRLAAAYKAVDTAKLYSLAEAIATVQANAKAKFDETIEISMNLGIDPRHADQMVRGLVGLPNGTGKTLRVGVFARGAKAEEALAAGADVVMLDNFTPERVAEAVKKVAGRVPLEASGGITLDNVALFARAGVDYISVGALTHSVRAADLALEVVRD